MGLFLCREILAITGLTITEEGEFGSGARFVIRVGPGLYKQKKIQLNLLIIQYIISHMITYSARSTVTALGCILLPSCSSAC